MSDDHLLDEAEAARILRVSTRTLRKERQAGRIAFVKIRRSIRYAPSDIRAFIDACRVTEVPRVVTRNVRRRGHQNEIVSFTARRDARMKK